MYIIEQYMASLKELSMLTTVVRLLMAAIFGGMIGMERGRRRQAAGLRTHMLVCLGASLVMLMNQHITIDFPGSDPSRLGAQVISGIGFLGVGTIIVDRQQQVRGLTTAAGLWTCACMGLAIGVGFYSGAAITCVLILITNVLLNKFEQVIINKSRTMEIYVEFTDQGGIHRFLNQLMASSIKVIQLDIVKPRNNTEHDDEKIAAIIMLRLPKRKLHASILEEITQSSDLTVIEEVL